MLMRNDDKFIAAKRQKFHKVFGEQERHSQVFDRLTQPQIKKSEDTLTLASIKVNKANAVVKAIFKSQFDIKKERENQFKNNK